MKFSTNILYLFYLVLPFSNCVQEFHPPSKGYENLLVIEAFLTDGDDAFEVKLSRSIPIDTSGFVPEPGAEVSLSDDSGENYQLEESEEPGVYFFPGEINPQIGKSYQIHVQTRNGNQYESSSVTMRETPEIDSISFRYEEKPTEGLKGLQIYANTHDPANATKYYRWEWDEAWTFRTPYNSYIIWEDGQILDRKKGVNVCWKFGRSTAIEIATTKNLSNDWVSEYPLNYVSTETDRLKMKYSIRVKQYALSEESYNYWLELQKATENLGTLFDPQPSIVYGNIYNVNDEDEVVLGYFDSSSSREQRIFITSRDLPPTRYPNYFSYCEDSIVSPRRVEEMIDNNWWLVEETTNDFGFPVFILSRLPCIDCTLYGTNEKPDYWD